MQHFLKIKIILIFSISYDLPGKYFFRARVLLVITSGEQGNQSPAGSPNTFRTACRVQHATMAPVIGAPSESPEGRSKASFHCSIHWRY
ncbi:hypothetical protein D3OALGA1CA_965 [Olavius algarvensis associated proteobacterium Delta 3]|nr:hypothetical protein D3OALGA1CA_965 [Olavius algarvensis associated proteobacterium Delta 3]CAB5129923.1 hypothetical protein D3OALGB2SA_3551 [Olavius algarvensis associated proteobacterium Delta 3]